MKKKYCTYSKCFVFFPLERKRLWLFPILWPPAEENKWYIPFLLCLNTSHSGAPSTVKINAFMPATMWRQTLIFIGRHYRKWDFPFISWKQSSHQVPSSPEAKPNELLKDDGVLCFLLITFFFWCTDGWQYENDKPGCRPWDSYKVSPGHSSPGSLGPLGLDCLLMKHFWRVAMNNVGGSMCYAFLKFWAWIPALHFVVCDLV